MVPFPFLLCHYIGQISSYGNCKAMKPWKNYFGQQGHTKNLLTHFDFGSIEELAILLLSDNSVGMHISDETYSSTAIWILSLHSVSINFFFGADFLFFCVRLFSYQLDFSGFWVLNFFFTFHLISDFLFLIVLRCCECC